MLASACLLLVALRFTWCGLGSLGITYVHSYSHWFTWVDMGLLGFNLVHLRSLVFTWALLGLLGFNRVHLVHSRSLKFIRDSLGFICGKFGSLGFNRDN